MTNLDSGHIGSITEGKRADIVLWEPSFFGVKPEIVMLGGSIACAQMGDPNASIPTPQPVYSRPMFASFGRSLETSSITFVSKSSIDSGNLNNLNLAKETIAVENTRNISKSDMVFNTYCPDISVDPETYEVRADGNLLTCKPATELPLAQRYFLF